MFRAQECHNRRSIFGYAPPPILDLDDHVSSEGTLVNITERRYVGVLSHEQSCVYGSGVQESAVTAQLCDTPPDMVVMIMCPLRVTMVKIQKIL